MALSAACGDPTLITVDSTGNVGKWSSLALNSSGFPVISYYDAYPNNDLKVAVLQPPAVGPGNTLCLPLIQRDPG